MTAIRIVVPTRANMLVVLGYVAFYIFLDWISYVDPYGPLGITPWNPPPALSIFLVMRYGPAMAPWLWAAAIAAEILVRGVAAPLPIVLLGCGCGHDSILAGKSALRRRCFFDDRGDSLWL